MASRLFQFNYTYERDITRIHAKIAIGATGAPTLTLAKGIVSMTRTAAGAYTITLKDNYYLFMDAKATFISSTSAPAAPNLNVVSETVNSSTSPQILIQFRDLSAVATDPASGETLLLELVFRNAST